MKVATNKKPSIKFSFNLEPTQAIDYLKNKGFKLTFDYDEMLGEAHHKAFTVAKVTRHDVLTDIFNSLQQAQKSGQRFEQWRDELKPDLQKKGWWGKKELTDPKTGEIKEVYIGSRRLRTIFNTNMRVAFNVQRYRQMMKLTQSVYWYYNAMMLPNTRDNHAAMNGTLLHRTNSFWNTNYPPNGWNCKCKVRAYSKQQAEKRGIKITKGTPKSIADKDWSHDIGAGSRVAKLTKMKLGSGLSAILPNLALAKLTAPQLKERFYNTLGIKQGKQFIDKTGDPMSIGDELFTNSATGASKITKQDRHLYIDELAKTISDPDEIFLEYENRTGKGLLVKKMFRYFKDQNGENKAFMALFTYQQDKTIGTSIYVVKPAVIDKKRVEKLIYQKEQTSKE